MERIDVRSKLLVLAAMASLPLVAAKQVSAQQRIPLAIDDALNTRTLPASSRVAVSPDGRWVALTLRENRRSLGNEIGLSGQPNPRTGVSDEGDASDVWIVRIENGQATNLTGGEGSNWEPTWSPDGTSIAFLSDRDGGETNGWLWAVRDRVLRRVSKRAVRAVPGMKMRWTPDSKRVLVTALPEDITAGEYAKSVASVGKMSDKDREPHTTISLFSSEATRLSGEKNSAAVMTNLDEAYRHDLVLIDVDTGAAETLVRNERLRDYSLSHDGATVAYAVPKRFYRPASWQIQCDLVTVDVKSKRRRVLASEVILAPEFRWSPADSSIVFSAIDPSDGSASYYLVSREGAPSRKVSFPANHPLRHAAGPSWDSSGQWFYFVNDKLLWRAAVADATAVQVALVPNRTIIYALERAEGDLWMPGGNSAVVLTHDEDSKLDGFYRVDLSNENSSLLMERAQSHVMMPFTGLAPRRIAVCADGRSVVFLAEDSQHPPDVWISDARFEHPRQLTHLNPQFDRYE